MSGSLEQLSSVDDFYYAYMINKRLKHYNSEPNSKLSDAISKQVSEVWADGFDPETFFFLSNQGVTMETLKLVEMMASVA